MTQNQLSPRKTFWFSGTLAGLIIQLSVWVALTFTALIYSIECKAEDPVTLLVWMEDAEPQAFSKISYEAAIATWAEMNIGTIRPVFVEFNHEYKLLKLVDDALLPADKIGNIIIATHGDLDAKKNLSLLQGLGEFGEQGATKLLKRLIQHIGRYLAPELHISFQSCLVACGTESAFQARASGLRKEVAKYGVRRLSIWGAKKSMVFDEKFRPVSSKEHQDYLTERYSNKLRLATWFTILVGHINFFVLPKFFPATPQFPQTFGIFIAGIQGVHILRLGLRRLGISLRPPLGIDTQGTLVILEKGSPTQIFKADATTPESLRFSGGKCEALLKSYKKHVHSGIPRGISG